MTPHHTCTACAGRGIVSLAPHLAVTWEALDEAEGRTPADVARRCDATVAAVAHRLGTLAGLGLARIVRLRPGGPKRCKPSAEWVRLPTPEAP